MKSAHAAVKVEWKNLSDVKVGLPATDYTGNQYYVFNIKGNKYRPAGAPLAV
ncbi:MAG: type II toxin-antitoxin system HigB family toxin [Odoribacteraceae bacterium]|nr:type II toxin-antitoxin system HigB family toxin [Odoribacteraceae bacterium]